MAVESDQEHGHWQEVMDLAQHYGFIIQAYGGVAMLATHEEQKKAGLYERTQKAAGLWEEK